MILGSLGCDRDLFTDTTRLNQNCIASGEMFVVGLIHLRHWPFADLLTVSSATQFSDRKCCTKYIVAVSRSFSFISNLFPFFNFFCRGRHRIYSEFHVKKQSQLKDSQKLM